MSRGNKNTKPSLLLTASRVAELMHLSRDTESQLVMEYFHSSDVWGVEVHPKGLINSSEFFGGLVECLDQAIDYLGNHSMYK